MAGRTGGAWGLSRHLPGVSLYFLSLGHGLWVLGHCLVSGVRPMAGTDGLSSSAWRPLWVAPTFQTVTIWLLSLRPGLHHP